MTIEKTQVRRRYTAEMKAQVVAQCEGAGASVAKVAMAHGINANVVHRWRQLAGKVKSAVAVKTDEFMPVPLAVPPVSTVAAVICVELRRNATAMTITWPTSAAADFSLWTRELLR